MKNKNQALHIAQKLELWAQIKRLGDLYEEDEDFTREYAREVYNANLEALEGAIKCFRELVCQAEIIYPKRKRS